MSDEWLDSVVLCHSSDSLEERMRRQHESCVVFVGPNPSRLSFAESADEVTRRRGSQNEDWTVLWRLLVAIADWLPDGPRQHMKAWAPLLVATRQEWGEEKRRAWVMADWAVRRLVPHWLRVAGLPEIAAYFADRPELPADGRHSESLVMEQYLAQADPKLNELRLAAIPLDHALWGSGLRDAEAAHDLAWGVATKAADLVGASTEDRMALITDVWAAVESWLLAGVAAAA